MFITIKKYININQQYSFDDLFNNNITPTTNNIKQHTIEINVPKNPPQHIQYCKQRLTQLITQYPEINTLTKKEIAACYTKTKIPKKNGGFRTINAPNEYLKTIQRRIVQTLQDLNALEHDSAFAYVKGRSIYNAIERHQQNNSKWFYKIDLKDFFGSCNAEFIYRQLKQIYPFTLLTSDPECDMIIKNIIKVACLQGKLPQGNPISPYLTNLIMVPIDYKLNVLAPVYTRYSDDMLFSARHKINTTKLYKQILDVLKETPLFINNEKTRLGSINGNNWNLGLMLNKDNNITLGHEKKRRFKATIDQFLYNPKTYSITECQKLSGLIAYYLNIEPHYIRHIIAKYNKKHNADLLNLLHNPL